MHETQADVEADDATLVEAARTDPPAFAALYERYLGPVYRYCYVRLGSREAAQDATSEVFLKAFAGLGGYRGGRFAAWIYRIAHNAVTDRQRQGRADEPFDAAEGVVEATLTPEEAALARGERERLHGAVATLPDDQRAAIELRLAGWPDVQIAATLGKSVAAVKKLRYRAVRRLRKLLVPVKEDVKGGA